jgi:hypothetical protein
MLALELASPAGDLLTVQKDHHIFLIINGLWFYLRGKAKFLTRKSTRFDNEKKVERSSGNL